VVQNLTVPLKFQSFAEEVAYMKVTHKLQIAPLVMCMAIVIGVVLYCIRMACTTTLKKMDVNMDGNFTDRSLDSDF